jgi:hypothetical protein
MAAASFCDTLRDTPMCRSDARFQLEYSSFGRDVLYTAGVESRLADLLGRRSVVRD